MSPATRRTALMMGGLMLVALGLRLPGLARAFWLDEYATAWVVQGDWSEVPGRSAMNNQPPLYFALAWVASRTLGYHEAGLRIPSLLVGIALVPTVWWLARKLGLTASGAWLSAALVAVARNCVFTSLEVRPYGSVQLVAAVQVGLFADLLDFPAATCGTNSDSAPRSGATRRMWVWLGWIITTAMLLYLHFLAGLILVPEAAFVLSRSLMHPRQHKFREILMWGGALTAVGCLATPLLATVREVHGNRAVLGSWITLPTLTAWLGTAYALPLVAAGAALAWSLRIISPPVHFGPLSSPSAQAPGGATDGTTSAGLPPQWVVTGPPGHRNNPWGLTIQRLCPASWWSGPALFLLMWIFLPLLAAWGLGRSGLMTLTEPRYMITMWIAPLLWVAEQATRNVSGRRLAWGSFLAIALVSTPALLRGYAYRPTPPWPELPRLIELANQPMYHSFPVLYSTQLVEVQQLDTDPRPLLPAYLTCPVTTLHPLTPPRTVSPIPDRKISPAGTATARVIASIADEVRNAGGCLWFGRPLPAAELAALWRHPHQELPEIQIESLADHLHVCRLRSFSAHPDPNR